MRRGTYLRTPEILLKQSLAQKGKPSSFKGKHHTPVSKKLLSEASKRQWREGRGVAPWTGKKLSPEHRQKISLGGKGKQAGEKHYNWKGGIKRVDTIYLGTEYAEWRMRVFKRDRFTCQMCGVSGKRLHADHKLPKCLFPKSMFHLSNGRTLCEPCHRKTPSYGVNRSWMTQKIYGISANARSSC